jgi:glycosyl transferase family 25
MKIYVINLERSLDRRNFMASQLRGLGLDFEFFPAVDGKALSEKEISENCDFRWMKRYEGREMTRGEIGCALSHLGVYRKMTRDNVAAALILEDDACLPADFAAFFKAISNSYLTTKPTFYLLNNATTKNTTAKFNVAGHAFYPMKGGMFSHAYIINNLAAKVMLRELFPIAHMADCWSWLCRHNLLEMFCLSEPYVQQGVVNNSLIWANGLPVQNDPLYKKISNKVYRVFWKIVDLILPLSWR